MSGERLSLSLLNGDFLHCRPVEGKLIVEAVIVSVGEEMPFVEKAIVCPSRIPSSRCQMRKGDYCHWYKGDGFGYMIIGPGMDKKLEKGYEDTREQG